MIRTRNRPRPRPPSLSFERIHSVKWGGEGGCTTTMVQTGGGSRVSKMADTLRSSFVRLF